ncbi:hypothetical protein BDY24DRAFT_392479 [Mrakia frigida]|uniref:uncharacterized protein n=1 Tax=Mrakia frigida TaxID=29902 RepID=UPI003FCBF061
MIRGAIDGSIGRDPRKGELEGPQEGGDKGRSRSKERPASMGKNEGRLAWWLMDSSV